MPSKTNGVIALGQDTWRSSSGTDVVTSVAMQCVRSRQTGGRKHRKLQLLKGLHGTQRKPLSKLVTGSYL